MKHHNKRQPSEEKETEENEEKTGTMLGHLHCRKQPGSKPGHACECSERRGCGERDHTR